MSSDSKESRRSSRKANFDRPFGSPRLYTVSFQLSQATPHGCHDLRESMSRARDQQMRELRHIHSKEGVKKTSWSCAELLKFAP